MGGEPPYSISTPTGRVFLAPAPLPLPTPTSHRDDISISDSLTRNMNGRTPPVSPASVDHNDKSRIQVLNEDEVSVTSSPTTHQTSAMPYISTGPVLPTKTKSLDQQKASMAVTNRRSSLVVVSPSTASTRIAIPFIKVSVKPLDVKVVLFVIKILSMAYAHNRFAICMAVVIASLDLISDVHVKTSTLVAIHTSVLFISYRYTFWMVALLFGMLGVGLRAYGL